MFWTRPAILSFIMLGGAIVAVVGCRASAADGVTGDDPRMAAYLRLVMPAQMRILEWTRPASLSGDGNADAVEVILEARDASDELTKVVGRFNFELQTQSPASAIGTRVGFWPVEINSAEHLRAYRDRLTRFYHFTLQLSAPLPAGRYALTAWLELPNGQRLFAEHTLAYDGGPVSAPSSF